MQNIGKGIKNIIYDSLVESHMIYGIVIWPYSLSKNVLHQFSNDDVPNKLKNVKKAQNQIIPKFDRFHCTKNREFLNLKTFIGSISALNATST